MSTSRSRGTEIRPAIELEPVRCPLCGSGEIGSVRVVSGWRIVRCARCRLAYLNPRPTEAELPRLYGADYFTRDISEAAEDPWTLTQAEISARVASQAERVALIERFARPGRLLDVGCGPGYLPAAARARGWAAEGRELSDWAVHFARERLELDVRTGTAFDVRAEDGPYDAITLYHTLEHLPDPLSALRHLRTALRPGGVLVVEVPNYGGLDARLFGDRWEGLRLPHHLVHFEPSTLRRLVATAGYDVIAVETDLPRPLLEGWVHLKAALRRPNAGTPEVAPAAGSAPVADSSPGVGGLKPARRARAAEAAAGATRALARTAACFARASARRLPADRVPLTGQGDRAAVPAPHRRLPRWRRRLKAARRLAGQLLPGRDMTLIVRR